MIANVVAKRFYNGEKALTATEITNTLDLPIRLTRHILNDFIGVYSKEYNYHF